jgi:hypothetical protein
MISFEVDDKFVGMPNPDLGNSEYLDLRTAIKITMAVTPRTIKKGPPIKKWRLAFTVLSGITTLGVRVPPSKFMEDLLTFVQYAMGKSVKFTNFDGSIQQVKFTKDTLEYLNSLRNSSNVTLELEQA